MKTIRVTVYKSETYTVELTDEEFELVDDGRVDIYQNICKNGLEPDDFGVDDVTWEAV